MQNGVTALMTAAGEGHVEVVEMLLNHKANVDLQDKVGCDMLHVLHGVDKSCLVLFKI